MINVALFLGLCYNVGMTLIGMPEAARRAGVSRNSIKRALDNAGIPLVEINGKAFAVEDSDLATFIAARGVSPGRGRPAGAKNKAKEQESGETEQ